MSENSARADLYAVVFKFAMLFPMTPRRVLEAPRPDVAVFIVLKRDMEASGGARCRERTALRAARGWPPQG
jgi:hypothetical protein